MPSPAKLTENTSKHWTREELDARAEAEVTTIPDRACTKLKPPPFLRGDGRAKAYWEATLLRMEGIHILDDLDAEALGILCAQLSRRDALGDLCRRLLSDAGQESDLTLRLELVSKLDALNSKLVALEKAILAAQGQLGLTPTGRVRLMRRRADAALEPQSDGLFGD